MYIYYTLYIIYTLHIHIYIEREAATVLHPHLDGNIPFDF